MKQTKRLGIGVIGFGWMGQAHSRGCRRTATHFPQRTYDVDLVIVSDTLADRQHLPGFAEALQYVSVQDALLRSWKSERWETVTDLRKAS